MHRNLLNLSDNNNNNNKGFIYLFKFLQLVLKKKINK